MRWKEGRQSENEEMTLNQIPLMNVVFFGGIRVHQRNRIRTVRHEPATERRRGQRQRGAERRCRHRRRVWRRRDLRRAADVAAADRRRRRRRHRRHYVAAGRRTGAPAQFDAPGTAAHDGRHFAAQFHR